MTPRLVFRPQAESELLDARRWYEERRLGLGRAFAMAVDEAVAGIVENPSAYPRVHGETRRALVRRFPYAIYFRVLPDEVIVLAVMHGRRLPRRWQSRR
ncbi:MAG: type II toxin-antitoxin system RelE/ParE family toxin [Deltaproteobacteria bacterium]|nr:type II toxin-antitoxin system RelE/ParE family toxin [Deltaproteobacteria bacterium]